MTILMYSPLEQFEFMNIFTLGTRDINLYFMYTMLFHENNIDFFNIGIVLDGISSYYMHEEQAIYDLFLEKLPSYFNTMPSVVIEGIFQHNTYWIAEQFFITDSFKSKEAEFFWSTLYGVIVHGNDDAQLIEFCKKYPFYPELLNVVFQEFMLFCQIHNPHIDLHLITVVEGDTERPAKCSEIDDLNVISTYGFTVTWFNIYSSTMIVIVVFFVIFIMTNLLIYHIHHSNIWNNTIDLFVGFLFETYASLVNPRLLKYFPLFVVLFILIFISNLTALIPFSFCLTSNLWFTLTLSLMIWVGVTVLAISVRGKEFFTSFVPSSVPSVLKPFLTIIEIISYVARAISLGVRIFANMLAGHSLVHILSDLVSSCIIGMDYVGFQLFAVFPAIILTFIVFIEFGICFLQALVFVILAAIYLNEAFGYNTH